VSGLWPQPCTVLCSVWESYGVTRVTVQHCRSSWFSEACTYRPTFSGSSGLGANGGAAAVRGRLGRLGHERDGLAANDDGAVGLAARGGQRYQAPRGVRLGDLDARRNGVAHECRRGELQRLRHVDGALARHPGVDRGAVGGSGHVVRRWGAPATCPRRPGPYLVPRRPENMLATSRPCAMGRPNRVVLAYASSRWIGFVSSDSSLNSLMSSARNVLVTSLASPTLCLRRTAAVLHLHEHASVPSAARLREACGAATQRRGRPCGVPRRPAGRRQRRRLAVPLRRPPWWRRHCGRVFAQWLDVGRANAVVGRRGRSGRRLAGGRAVWTAPRSTDSTKSEREAQKRNDTARAVVLACVHAYLTPHCRLYMRLRR